MEGMPHRVRFVQKAVGGPSPPLTSLFLSPFLSPLFLLPPLFFPLLARYVGLAGSGLGEGVKANPQTKIFSHQCGGHLQPVGG